MNFDLKGKVVGITGAANGIGFALAKGFGYEGCRLILSDIDKNKLDEKCFELEKQGFDLFWGQMDISKKISIKRFVKSIQENFSHVDVWINNAGVMLRKKLLNVTQKDFERIFLTNVSGIINCTQALFPLMKCRNAIIINACSFSSIMPSSYSGLYASSKAAVLSLTKSLAAELAPFGFRVCAYTPGHIQTSMTTSPTVIGKNYDLQKIISNIALHRPGVPSDLIGPVLFLASEAANYITGVSIEVTGGKFCVQNPMRPWED